MCRRQACRRSTQHSRCRALTATPREQTQKEQERERERGRVLARLSLIRFGSRVVHLTSLAWRDRRGEQQKGGMDIGGGIAPEEAPRLKRQAVSPFQPGRLHPMRRAAILARQEVE